MKPGPQCHPWSFCWSPAPRPGGDWSVLPEKCPLTPAPSCSDDRAFPRLRVLSPATKGTGSPSRLGAHSLGAPHSCFIFGVSQTASDPQAGHCRQGTI